MLVSAIPMIFYKIDEPTKKLMREELLKRREGSTNIPVDNVETCDQSPADTPTDEAADVVAEQ
jgi:Na+/melibiose symporter-like transporter